MIYPLVDINVKEDFTKWLTCNQLRKLKTQSERAFRSRLSLREILTLLI